MIASRPPRSPDGDDRPHVVVLGAGVCGLYAGLTLARAGCRVTLLEREPVVGGLAAGREIRGNYYDLGVHHLHAFDEEIFQDVRTLMGPRLIPVEKKALIRYGRGYRRYPLEFFDLLTGIPPWTLFRALTGLVAQQLRNRVAPREATDAEQALVELYGRPLYRFFFQDFTTRYWGQPPDRLSASFVRRKMPRLSAVDLVKRALGRAGVGTAEDKAVESALAEETLWYSRTGSREMPMALAAAIEERGGHIWTDSPVTGLDIEGGRVRALRVRRDGREERVDCDACLSTIPLGALVAAAGPSAPAAVRASAAALRHRPMVAYGLRVARPRVLDALYVYYRDRVFHRLAEPKNSGMRVDPEAETILLVELMCERDDAIWRAAPEAVDRVMDDLEAEGLLRREEVRDLQVVRASHAYPVFDLGFEPHLERVQGWVAEIPNLDSTGRQGGFCYPNMHSSMRMGADAATTLAAVLAPQAGLAAAGPAELGAREPIGRAELPVAPPRAASSAGGD